MLDLLIAFSCVALISITIVALSVARYCYARNFREDQRFKHQQLRAAVSSPERWDVFDATYKERFESDYLKFSVDQGGE